MKHRQLVKNLPWIGIGLGVAELLLFRRVGRLAGIGGSLALARLFGGRGRPEGPVAARRPAGGPALGAAAGHVMDAALTALGELAANAPRRRSRTPKGLAANLAIGALDIACAAALRRRAGKKAAGTAERTG